MYFMPVRLLGLYGARAHTHLGRKALYNTSNLARIYGRRINPELNMASAASLRNFQAKYIGLQMPLDKALLVSRNPRTIPPIYTGSFSFSAHSKPFLHTYIHICVALLVMVVVVWSHCCLMKHKRP